MRKQRTFMVVDGDNLRSISEESDNNVDWAKFLIYLRTYLKADVGEFFFSWDSLEEKGYWDDVARRAGYRPTSQRIDYSAPRGQRGLPDIRIINSVKRRMEAYQRIIIVSSDSDFWPLIYDLNERGNDTVLVTHREGSASWRPPNMVKRHVELRRIIKRFEVPVLENEATAVA